jgi:putative transposase
MAKPACFKSLQNSLETIRLGVLLHIRFPLSLLNVEDLLHGREIDMSYETIR